MLMSMSIIIKSIRLKRGNAYRMVRPLKVRLGTDCSGTDSPLYGVKQTQLYKKGLVSVSHEWSCEISTAAQEFTALNHRPKQFFADVRKRSREWVAACGCLREWVAMSAMELAWKATGMA